MPKWGNYDKVDPGPSRVGHWVIASMKLNSGNTYYPEYAVHNMEKMFAAVIDDSNPVKATEIVICFDDGSSDTLRFREDEPVL